LAQLPSSIDCDMAQDCLEKHHGSAMYRERNGGLVRMAEIADQTEQVAVESDHLQEGQAERCNVVEDSAGETPVTANTIHLMVKSFEILALRLWSRPARQP